MDIDELITKAESGDPIAQYELSIKYSDGDGIEKNHDKALYWAELSAAQNCPEGMNSLGFCYYNGIGVEKDEIEAVRWYRKAAEQGYARAQCNLGICYEYGTGVEKDEAEAVKWFREAAEQEFAQAQCNLGYCYERGIGVEKAETEAVRWYRKAAEQGDAQAQYNLGVCYNNGRGVEKDDPEAVKWYRKAVEQGFARAQCNLGNCYEYGTGVEKDEIEAAKWFSIAAEQGYAQAQCNLGICYNSGTGVKKDEVKAVKWYSKAAEQGYAKAQYNLGVCYVNGEGVEKDDTEAVKWYRKATEQGYAPAQYNLGVCYANGTGVGKDEVEAVKWYRKAAEQGYAKAQCNLGFCYDSGTGVEKDEAEAVKWFRKAAEQGVAQAQYNLGVCYDNGRGLEKDISEAVRWFRKAAVQGDAQAQCNLGACYYNGTGVEKDEGEAVKWLRKAAEQGDTQAQCNLGVCYEFGNGVKKDEVGAVKWYRKAAKQGLARAQCNLGFCYANGTGVEKDEAEAVRWYRKAAEQDGAMAQNNLGVCYERGTGVEKDEGEAVRWYRKAAKQGNATAQCNLGSCYEHGTGVEKDEAEAVRWYRKAAEQGFDEARIALDKLLKTSAEESEKNWELANAGKRYDLFVSWNHKDKEFKDKLVAGIESFNFDGTGKNDERVFPHYRAWESDRDANDEIKQSVLNAINNSKYFLVILSENSIKSEWVRLEVKAALDRVERGIWSPKNLLIIYLNSPNTNVCSAIDALNEGDVFRKLKKYAAQFTENGCDDRTIDNICNRIKLGLEESAVFNYRYRMTKENDNFKYSLRNQYVRNDINDFCGIADALLSFEEGYIQRNLYSVPDGAEIEFANLTEKDNFFIVGEGGSGKSLYVSNLMRNYFDTTHFFLRINVIDYDDYIENCNNLTDLLSKELNRYLVDSDEYHSPRILERARGDAGNPITVIFDGLDEIGSEKRKKLIELIRDYLKRNRTDRFIFTSRTAECFDDLKLVFNGKLSLCELRGFDETQRKKLYDNIKSKLYDKAGERKPPKSDTHWGRDLYIPTDNPIIGDDFKADFFVHLDSIGDEIKKNPLLLSNLIFIYLKNRGKDFPTSKYAIVKKSIGIFIDDLENDRGIVSCFPYRQYLTKDRLKDMLGNIAFRKLQGCAYDFRKLLIEYFKNGHCLNNHDPETVGNEIYDYLSRRAIITSDKITHDIFTAYFACCYIFDNVYETRCRYDNYCLSFRKGLSGDPEYSGEIYLRTRMNTEGEFGRADGMWPEVSSEFIMKLDSEIHSLSSAPMSENNPNYPVFDTTLTLALKERGFSDDAIKVLREFAIRNNGFYFRDFILKYLDI